MSGKPTGAGKSSFDLIDRKLYLTTVGPLATGPVLDLGCGAGNYSVALAAHLGPGRTVYGVDLWDEGVAQLEERAGQENLENLRAMTGNAAGGVPLPDQAVGLILLNTVFHDFVDDGVHRAVLAEMQRVLTPEGGLAVVEFKKQDGPPGPPEKVRLAPDELKELLAEGGFAQTGNLDLGEHVYLSLFKRTA